MKKSKKKASSTRYYVPPMPSAVPKNNSIFLVACIVFGAIFLFTLGFVSYVNFTGQAISSSGGGGGGEAGTITIVNGTCYDSDGSLTWPNQYFVKGYCIDSTTNITKWDFCGNATNGSSSCFEYYCNYQKKCANIQMPCANLNESTGQCSNGACVRKNLLVDLSNLGEESSTLAENGTNGTNSTNGTCYDTDGGLCLM